ncbi:flap endonuclease GEN [Musca vetustissima]|uniref:flap endonuclease GEN n=1 Tax=Musca vetustissima TaxID=27455 RepID=UPI002AB76056|nr:flap endonuclease GEN [Musca vetustissima]
MGVKDLWTILTPHAERKPICELRGKTVAIDLAGWVCESLNVVDYFVHPRHHLKNLFFRTCYLIWEEVTPVFVLEGTAPKLKSQVMEKRNEIQFRGVRPKDKPPTQSQQPTNSQSSKGGEKGRSRFNMVLKQCENLLTAMGIQCVQGPGEAEAYCAFLNQKGLVDGVISQDSDCFAYGAVRVYRNFSVSSQGALAAQGGAVDIYDMRQICSKMDFGQNKVIVMALLCGCDYCPDGIGGIGRDSVVKLFNKYTNDEILNKIRCWRYEDAKYSALEMRVDDKSICTNCGHLGRTQSHTKSGCGVCRTNRGCDESLWKEERLSIKAELTLRKKALADPTFPSEAIIEEFLKQPKAIPKLDLRWRQPNMVKFIKQIGHLLQWQEIYCFQKFFPILTRWQVMNAVRLKEMPSAVVYIVPKEIVKKRVVKSIPSLEIVWHDEKGIFSGLVPDVQLQDFESENPKGITDLWTTVEPMSMMETAFPEQVEAFLKSKEKPKKAAKKPRNKAKPLSSLENLDDLIKATNEVSKTVKPKRQTKPKSTAIQGMQSIDKYFKQTSVTPLKTRDKLSVPKNQSSTPLTKSVPSDLESDDDEDPNAFNLSDIVNGIVAKDHAGLVLTTHQGRQLQYEAMPKDISLLLNELNNSITLGNTSHLQTKPCIDDTDVLCEKRVLSISFQKSTNAEAKRRSLDDSFDVLVKIGTNRVEKIKEFKISTENLADISSKPLNVVDRFKQKQRISLNFNTNNSIVQSETDDANGVSYFFNSSFQTENEDVFEKLMETSLAKRDTSDNQNTDDDDDGCILLSD